MPRLARLPFIPFGWHYVRLRSMPNRRIVTNHADLSKVLQVLRVTLRGKNARLHAGYVGEHEVHLALQTTETPLAAIVGGFQHEYARVFNRTHAEQGSLFRLHHHELLIQHRQWLVPLVHFIHWIRRLDRPDDHWDGLWWSSDAAYREDARQNWLTTHAALRMLTHGAYNREAQKEAYRRLLDHAPDPDHVRLFGHGSAEDARILGDGQFIAEIRRRMGRRAPDRRRRAPQVEGDIAGAVMWVVERFNALCDKRLPQRQAEAWRQLVTFDNVRSRSRKRPLPMVRALSVSHLIDCKVATPTQAARFFGCGPKPVSARRRRFYCASFCKELNANPKTVFCPHTGDQDAGTRNDDQED